MNTSPEGVSITAEELLRTLRGAALLAHNQLSPDARQKVMHRIDETISILAKAEGLLEVLGTPKTLTQCIERALRTDTVPKIKDVHTMVKDYLAQRFAIAIGRDWSPEKEVMLRKLFEEIVR